MQVYEGATNKKPGNLVPFKKGTMCDVHVGRPSFKRVIVEVDTFGYEAADMCCECYKHYQEELQEKANENTCCDLCGNVTTGVKSFRDPEEGTCGPLYQACEPCRTKANKYFVDNL